MAPLDTGSVSPALRLVDPLGDRVGPSPEHFDVLGLYLRAVREHRGWSLAELAAGTRIRRAYIAAIEDGDMSALPSRPFALGYVRAYAKALGLDGELAVARFKQEHPDAVEPLRAPVGVKHESQGRRPVFVIAGLVLVAAVVVWNVIQRVTSAEEPQAIAKANAEKLLDIPAPPLANGAFALAGPTAPPSESTTPAPYITPGLENVLGPMTAAARAEAPSLDQLPPGSPFQSSAAVYGAPLGIPSVIVQARKSALLVIRRPDKEVFLARQMKAGESARAPLGHGYSVDVTDPTAFYAYVNNALFGVLPSAQAGIDALAQQADAVAKAAQAAAAPSPGPASAPSPASTPGH